MAIKFLNSVNADSGVLYVDAANDRVGIGTTSPSDILSVNSSSTETILHLTNTSTGTATSDGLRIGLVGASAYFLLRENANMLFHTNNTERMRITSAGNVGIGTTSPDEKLTVSGNIRIANNAKLYLWNDHDVNFIDYKEWQTSSSGGMTIENQSSTGHVNIISNGNTGFYLNNIGNVGIGTTSPAAKLDVSGKIQNNAVIESKSGGTSSYIAHSASTDTYIAIAGRVDSYPAPSANASSIVTTRDGGTYPFNSYGHLVISSRHDSSRDILFRTNNTDRMVIQGDGDVGIGTTSPTAPLTFGKSVYGAESSENYFRIKFQDQGGTHNDVGIGQPASGALGFNVTAGNYFSFNNGTSGEIARLNGTGLGIGTTSPAQKLDVDGNIQILDTDTVDGNVFGYLNFHSTSGGSTGNHARIASIRDSNGAGQMLLYTKTGGAATEKVRITSAGNVGIGTTSPNAMLHVTDSIQVDGGDTFGVDNAGHQIYMSSGGSGLGGEFGTGYARNLIKSDGSATIHIGDNTSLISRILLDAGSAGTSGYISLQTKQVERVRVTADGNVGIGTTSPSGKLTVYAPNGNSDSLQIGRADSGSLWKFNHAGADLRIYNTDGSGSDILLGVDAAGTFHNNKVGIGTATPQQNLDVVGAARSTYDSSNYSQLESNASGGVFKALAAGATNILLRSYGDSYFNGGNLGVGTSSPSEKLEVSGNILASGDITAYSDARIKENVETLPNALESVKAMRGVTYNKIGEEKQSIGVIAQEVQAVLPQLVSEHKDEMLSVAYGNITAVLIEAIKEQQDIISQLEERIIDLENRF